jgi:hypothetical protein
MYWNFVAIDGVIKNQLQGKNIKLIRTEKASTYLHRLWGFVECQVRKESVYTVKLV